LLAGAAALFDDRSQEILTQMPTLKRASFNVPLKQQTRMVMVMFLQKKSQQLYLQRAQKASGSPLSTESWSQRSERTQKARHVGRLETNMQITKAIFSV
jgi:hypothetical protein